MEVHRPKGPVHGWREFVGEVGIIVLGVLIALGAEQVVETLRWRHEVKAARVSLLDDAKYAIGAIRYRKEKQPCVEARLQQVHALISRHATKRPLGLLGPVGEHVRGGATTGTWDVAVAGQVLTHMSDQERLSFSNAFGDYRTWNEEIEKESIVWNRLAKLSEPELLNEQGWADVLDAYWIAVHVNRHINRLATLFTARAGLGLPDLGPNKLSGENARADAEMCRRFAKL